MVIMTPIVHGWRVTAPWWRWTAPDGTSRAGVPRFGRATAPELQKFAEDDFINAFLADPQRSIRYEREIDEVHAVNLVAADPGQFAGKFASFFPLTSSGAPATSPGAGVRKPQLVPTGVRKVYLPSHARHYLIVCELHCDVPGFPAVPAAEVCQAGFVVRRRRLAVPEAARPEARRLLRDLVAAQAQLGDLEETLPVRPALAASRAKRIARWKSQGEYETRHAAASQAVAGLRETLDKWRVDNGVDTIREGWAQTSRKTIGEWRIVEEEPQLLQEATYPLYRLHADPTKPNHDAAGRAIYFGVLPTGGLETTASGQARYDSESTYEIATFFRRHDCCCPCRGLNVDAPDCGGRLTWSQPTKPYRLAPQADLIGTANRPVTIQMPDLAELAAQALSRPAGRFSPFKFVQPQTLHPSTDGMGLSGGKLGPGSICSFSIPLITIIALFLLNLFLPIVIFLFGLWFLLALKLCILPEVKVDGGLQAELALLPPKLDVAGEFAVDVDAGSFSLLVGGDEKTGTEINTALAGELEDAIEAAYGKRPSLDGFSNTPLIGLSNVLTEHTRRAETAGADGALLDLEEGLAYEPRRICQWRHEPYLVTTGEFA